MSRFATDTHGPIEELYPAVREYEASTVLRAHPPSAGAATGPHGFGVAPLRAPWQTSLVAHRICPMRAATTTPAEPQDAILVSSPVTAAFPVIVAGRLPQRSFRGLLGVHRALRPAWPADSRKEPSLGVLQPIRHLLVRPKCFRLGRASPVGICTRGFNVPCKAYTIMCAKGH